MVECAAALPMAERVGLALGDFVVLGGEGEADLPEKKDRSHGYQSGEGLGSYILSTLVGSRLSVSTYNSSTVSDSSRGLHVYKSITNKVTSHQYNRFHVICA